MFNAALRAAVEHCTRGAADIRADAATARAEPAEALRSALTIASHGLT
ncbi:hypothetical protein [Streptomyces aurantiogriseus]|uniref:Uncharacterized protein n=1 Tax=Streptomyces aurantiogriseus TaxID=66870 RepID=A0A918FMH9_9ACTN|nr:hypothetical protein [Streptomyces aurantiogriseus]GGR55976.1 hypothetical protein GCM10010251_86150 [Streptomyces aurantiogriseus]